LIAFILGKSFDTLIELSLDLGCFVKSLLCGSIRSDKGLALANLLDEALDSLLFLENSLLKLLDVLLSLLGHINLRLFDELGDLLELCAKAFDL
jgi:hypothetical protein